MSSDFHIHSNLSDCSWDRRKILVEAKKRGLDCIAFTEHDTTKNADDGVRLGKEYGIKVIKGIEISAFDFKTGKKAHILGYGYKTNKALEQLCTPTLQKRHNNCLKQIEILHSLGYKITAEDVMSYTKSGIIYKQHILAYLVDSGQSETMFGDIYKNIFKNGGACDFDIEYVCAEDAVKAICEDGGKAVLAHPAQQNNFELVKKLVPLGLKGIERNHPSHTENDHKIVDSLANEYRLFCTGGSDFHGDYEARKTSLGNYTSVIGEEILLT